LNYTYSSRVCKYLRLQGDPHRIFFRHPLPGDKDLLAADPFSEYGTDTTGGKALHQSHLEQGAGLHFVIEDI